MKSLRISDPPDIGARVEVGLILALTMRGLQIHSYPQLARVAKEAERLGFASLWLCDHFLTVGQASYGERRRGGAREEEGSEPLLECWTTLSALARETSRIRLGTSVICNGYRYPSVLAKMAATLDVISEGRLELGLGAGWLAREFEAYGIPFPSLPVRLAQLDEALEVIRAMWTQPQPAFVGEHYQIRGAVCEPAPLQKPHPPIWLGGEGKSVHRIAARAANGINVRWWAPERFAGRRPFLNEACRQLGRNPQTLRLSVTAMLIPGYDPLRIRRLRERYPAIDDSGIISGTPDECVARIAAYAAQDVRHLLFTIPDVADSELLELTGAEVLPAVQQIR